tara:strand:+ start:952 stop:1449 length:498 start_codon:yes stop_codon:yes gene_type:complete
MKIVDIADEIFRELDQPTEVSIPQIAFWIRVNVGILNNTINGCYSINLDSLEITPDPGIEEKAIFKKLYTIHFYDIKLRSALGAASVDPVVEVTSDGATVRKLNRNQTSQLFLSLRKQESDDFNRLVANYKMRQSAPVQVVGDDTVAGIESPISNLNRLDKSSEY